jgi:hypothetical protein
MITHESGTIVKLKKMALISEIAGSFAVVVSLVVLILEVRANAGALEAATRQSIAARTEAITLNTAANPGLAGLPQDTEEVQPGTADELQLWAFYTALLRHTEEAFLQWQDGRLGEGYYVRRARGAFGAMDTARFRAYFEAPKSDYDPEFVVWVQENIFDQ